MTVDNAFFEGIYSKYRSAHAEIPLQGKYADYDWGNLPDPLQVPWWAYGEMFQEFSRDLANSVNQLVKYVHRLKAWSAVINGLDDASKLEVLLEFIDPVAIVTLNLPYAIQSRFIFATAHLAHQANITKDGNAWKDDLPLDREITFKTAEKYAAQWKSYETLRRTLKEISADDYKKATCDYRNKYNHRISPRIEIGLTGMDTRSKIKNGRIVGATGIIMSKISDQETIQYAFGATPPLRIEQIITALEEQCVRCHAAFEAFKALVQEHEAYIREH